METVEQGKLYSEKDNKDQSYLSGKKKWMTYIKSNNQESDSTLRNSLSKTQQPQTEIFFGRSQSSPCPSEKCCEVDNSSEFYQQISEESNSSDDDEDSVLFNSLQECFNEVIELCSDSINRNIEIEIHDDKRIEIVLEKLSNISIRRQEANKMETENEKLGNFLIQNISTKLSPLDIRKYHTFVGELDKVVLLQVLLRTRMRVLVGNLTDQEKERKEKLEKQLEEANKFKQISDKRLQNIVANIKYFFGDEMKDLFLKFVQTKEELILGQKLSYDLEKELLRELETEITNYKV